MLSKKQYEASAERLMQLIIDQIEAVPNGSFEGQVQVLKDRIRGNPTLINTEAFHRWTMKNASKLAAL
jgi:hypothetical protein